MKYKIFNTTFKLNKRDENYNKTLYFDYVDGIEKKTVTIKPSQLIYIELNKLPISLHKLRMQGLVTVLQVTDDEYYNELDKHKKILINNKNNSKKSKNNKKKSSISTSETNKKKSATSTTSNKKKTTSKKTTTKKVDDESTNDSLESINKEEKNTEI